MSQAVLLEHHNRQCDHDTEVRSNPVRVHCSIVESSLVICCTFVWNNDVLFQGSKAALKDWSTTSYIRMRLICLLFEVAPSPPSAPGPSPEMHCGRLALHPSDSCC